MFVSECFRLTNSRAFISTPLSVTDFIIGICLVTEAAIAPICVQDGMASWFLVQQKRPPGGDLFIYTLHYPSPGIFKGNACLASAGARPVTDATRRFSRRACHVAAGVVGGGMVNSFANIR